jgi:hypothetical protein
LTITLFISERKIHTQLFLLQISTEHGVLSEVCEFYLYNAGCTEMDGTEIKYQYWFKKLEGFFFENTKFYK